MVVSRHTFKAFAAAATLCVAMPASADVACLAAVTGAGLQPDGTVFIFISNSVGNLGYWVCNVTGTTSVNNGFGSVNITSDTCKGFLSQMMTAKASGGKVTFNFHGPSACDATAFPSSGSFGPFPYGIVL